MGRGPGFFEPSLCCCKAEHLLGPQSQNNSSFSRFKCSTNIKMSSDILERRSVISYRHELSDLQNHLSFMELENRNIWKIWIEEYWQNYICKLDLLAVLSRKDVLITHTFVCVLSHFDCFQLFAILWIEVSQVPLSVEFPGTNTGVGCHALLQEIFPTQGSNPSLH